MIQSTIYFKITIDLYMIQNLISDVAAGRHPWNPPTTQNDKKVDHNYIQQKESNIVSAL